MRVEKFVLNPTAFREQVLKGQATRDLLARVAGPNADTDEVKTRARARVYGDDIAALNQVIGTWHA